MPPIESLRVLTYTKRTLCYSFSLWVIFLVLTSESFEPLLEEEVQKVGFDNDDFTDVADSTSNMKQTFI